MRKALVLGGVVVMVAGQLTAAERSRGTTTRDEVRSSERAGRTVAQPSGQAQMVAPGVVVANLEGGRLTARQDGVVILADVLDQYGSVERFIGETHLATTLTAKSPEGDLVSADGAIFNFKDLTPTQAEVAIPKTATDYKDSMIWTSVKIGKREMIAFANGVVFPDNKDYISSEPSALSHRRQVLSMRSGTGYVFADGAVFPESEPSVGRK